MLAPVPELRPRPAPPNGPIRADGDQRWSAGAGPAGAAAEDEVSAMTLGGGGARAGSSCINAPVPEP
ncbi:MAG: hypothetical protein O7H41_17070 [Planctomycetota bacterium]|nr:hypothetical protein [Planctomycetota bacterium]